MKFLVIFLIFLFFDNALSVVTPDVKKATVTATPAKKLVCTKANEVLVPCPKSCPPETDCRLFLREIAYKCAPPDPKAPCVPKCLCKEGYVRNKTTGQCIKGERCCDNIPNAQVLECVNKGKPSCSDPFTAREGDPETCNRGCACKPGYIWNDAKTKCIRPEQCPKPICKPTEVYVPCRDPCPETCESIFIGPKLGCLPALPCPAGCDCRPGYVRDDEGECVPIDECPPPCGPNEEWDLCPPCPEGAICPALCLPACRCKDGYQYNDEGICEEALICGQNEVLNVCPRYCTFDPDCDSYMFGFIRDCAAPPDFFPCTPRCDCIKGYLRIDGTCQKPSKCCSDPFEGVVDCPAPCVETCSYKPPAGCKENCRIRTCRCVTGFVKYNGKCRPRASCPITKPTISPIAEDE